MTKLAEYESMLKVTENECARLRGMINELVASKFAGNPTEYIAIEEKLLEQTIALKEMRRQNAELSSALNRKSRENELLAAQLNDLEEELSKGLKKGGGNKQRRTIAGYKERIMELVNEVNSLRAELSRQTEINEEHARDNRTSIEIQQARVAMGEYRQKMEEAKSNEEAYKEKLGGLNRAVEEYKRRLEETAKRLEEYKRHINDNAVDIARYKADLNKMSEELSDKKESIKEAKSKLKTQETLHKKEIAQLQAKIEERNFAYEPLVEKESTLKPKASDIRDVVSEDEVSYIKLEARVRLIIAEVSKDKAMNALFADYNDNDSISIKELARRLSRTPLELSHEKSLSLARYAIEPRDSPKVEFDLHKEELVGTVRLALSRALEIPYNFEEGLIEKTLAKIKGNQIQLLNQLNNKKSPKQWMKVFEVVDSSLTQLDKDILIAIGFEESKDITKLSAKVSFTV